MDKKINKNLCGENPLCGGSGNCDTCRIGKIQEEQKDAFAIVSEYTCDMPVGKKTGYAMAVDIGTTTVAMQIVDMAKGEAVQTATFVNRQRTYGYDVVSRIKAASEGNLARLHQCIAEDMEQKYEELLVKSGIRDENLKEVIVAGNTTMIHLLMGYECSALGNYPFCSEHLNWIKNEKMTVFPGISAFVGSDIVAGMYALGIGEREEISLLIDLGTNGEMALGNKNRIVVTSTAAGPAFEGGNTGWGSGIIETAAELLEKGCMDKTGLLSEEYFETGYPIAQSIKGYPVVLTQKDVRSLQMAKAAVRTGVDILLQEYQITEQDVAHVYIAGGFGYHLDVTKAAAIGLFPEVMAKKAVLAGNTSLQGGVRFLMDENGKEIISHIIDVAEEVILSNMEPFNRMYIDNMTF